jgi:hypothetical protein
MSLPEQLFDKYDQAYVKDWHSRLPLVRVMITGVKIGSSQSGVMYEFKLITGKGNQFAPRECHWYDQAWFTPIPM